MKKVAPIQGIFDTTTGNLVAISLSETGQPQIPVIMQNSPVTVTTALNVDTPNLNRLNVLNGSSAVALTIQQETDSFSYPAGAFIELLQLGSGALTLTAASGVTFTGTAPSAAANAYTKLVRTSSNNWAYTS